MSDNVLDRFTRTLPKPSDLRESITERENDGLDEYGAFGWLRGVRDKAPMLECRDKKGNIRAFGFAWLHQAEFDPSSGIVLSFGTTQVRLIGWNLNAEVRPNVRLFQGLIRHRVPYVTEADEVAFMKAGDSDTIIERIVW